MLSAFWAFLQGELRPRLNSVFISSEAVIALAGGAAFAVWGSRLAVGQAESGDVVVAVLSYAAIAFGFSVAGLAIALTAPGTKLAHNLAWSDPQKPGLSHEPPTQNSYSNLLFIFTWTAIAHWFVVVGAFAALVLLEKDTKLLEGACPAQRIGVGLLAGITIYAVELFLVTLVTLAAVGSTYIRRLQGGSADDES